MTTDTERIPLPQEADGRSSSVGEPAAKPKGRAIHDARRDAPLGLYRPVLPDRGYGKWFRSVVGVKEDILDWAPEERPRYSRMGAIVLLTGLMAGLSLLVALNAVVEGRLWMLLPPAVLWAVMIITLDSWLLASTHGVVGGSKARLFLPRLVVSVLMGVVIAEPLLLWVFSPSIEVELAEHRKGQVERYSDIMRRCNPESGEVVADVACNDYRVTIPGGHRAVEIELAQTTTARDDARAILNGLNQELSRLEALARDECSGRGGPGLTGVRGEGGECKRNRQKADQFRADNQIERRQADLTALDNQVVSLTEQVSLRRAESASQVSEAINRQVAAKRANLEGHGLLDDMEALGRLSDRSLFVFLGQWMLRLLLIAIDIAPVLTKMMAGSTVYDSLVARQSEAAKRLHSKHLHLYERQDSVDIDVRLQRTEQKLRDRQEDINDGDRLARAEREAKLERQIEELAATLRKRQGAGR